MNPDARALPPPLFPLPPPTLLARTRPGTYTIFYTTTASGPHTISVSIGPEPANALIGSAARVIGSGQPLTVLTYSQGTTTATVRYRVTGLAGYGYIGVPMVLEIWPRDKYGNRQDYVYAGADNFVVSVSFNGVYTVNAAISQFTTLGPAPWEASGAIYSPPGVYLTVRACVRACVHGQRTARLV